MKLFEITLPNLRLLNLEYGSTDFDLIRVEYPCR